MLPRASDILLFSVGTWISSINVFTDLANSPRQLIAICASWHFAIRQRQQNAGEGCRESKPIKLIWSRSWIVSSLWRKSRAQCHKGHSLSPFRTSRLSMAVQCRPPHPQQPWNSPPTLSNTNSQQDQQGSSEAPYPNSRETSITEAADRNMKQISILSSSYRRYFGEYIDKPRIPNSKPLHSHTHFLVSSLILDCTTYHSRLYFCLAALQKV
jgi:hypothetical protein